MRISGVPVGKVKTIEADTATGRSDVTFELDPKYAPLPDDAQAILRQKTLLGETYVELTPGTKSAPTLAEGGRLAEGQVSETVELDEILRTFEPETREAFQVWMQSQAEAIDGHGRDINDALGNLGPFADDAAELVDILDRQEPAVQRLIRDTGVVFEALTERDGQLRDLIENSNRVFETTAARDRELQETFIALPTFERESRETIERLDQFARETDPLVTQLRPAARELSPTLDRARRARARPRGVLPRVQPADRRVEGGLPRGRADPRGPDAAARPGRPGAARAQPDPRLHRALQARADRVLRQHGGGHAGDDGRPAASQLHYLRTTNPFNPENLAVYPRRLGTNRTNAYTKPNAFDKLRTGLRVLRDAPVRAAAADAHEHAVAGAGRRRCRSSRCR